MEKTAQKSRVAVPLNNFKKDWLTQIKVGNVVHQLKALLNGLSYSIKLDSPFKGTVSRELRPMLLYII